MELIRDATKEDFASIVRLNEAEVLQTSPMSQERLQFLADISSYFKVMEYESSASAFLLAMGPNAPYENDNYSWFASRFKDFMYVDRIVVGPKLAGRGAGSKLYLDLFNFSRSHGLKTIVCEYNIEPPNPASKAFHDKLGFREVGRQLVSGGGKLVSLQAAET
ncbi:GNAT family N-acetyltransferase [Solilutibacter silvestris]|uniref:GNAT family N-acetyltransferase n=1 Tax=Solilutibacter silvestris TaxID=1645665 RepID=UPI003D32D5F9